MSERVNKKRSSRSGIKYTTEEVRGIIEKSGYEWLDDEYINSKTKLTIKDKNGYIYYTRLVGVIENRDLDFVGTVNPYSIPNMIKYIENNNLKAKIISDKYVSNSSPLVFTCEDCGDEYECSWNSFHMRHTTRCNECQAINRGKESRIPYSEVYERVSKMGYKLLTAESDYDGTKSTLTVKDNEGYLYTPLLDNIVRCKRPSRWHKSNPYSIDNIKKHIKDNNLGVNIVSTEYISNSKDLIFTCSICDSEYRCNFSNFISKNKILCNECSSRQVGDLYRHDIEFIKSEFIKNGYTPLFNSYSTFRDKLTARDSDGYLYKIAYASIWLGYKPLPFTTDNPYSIENIKTYIKNNNISSIILSDTWCGNSSDMEFMCECGSIFTRSWASFSISPYKTCNDCSSKKVGDLYRCDIELVKNEFKAKGFIPLFNEYKNSQEPLLFMTKEGYKGLVSYGCLPYKNGSRFVHLSNPYTVHNINKMYENEKWTSKPLITRWSGRGERYRFQCGCGRIYKTTWDCFLQSEVKMCERCSKSMSSLEYKVEQFLINKNILFEKEKRFDDCRFNYPLPFDFYLSDHNICIEADGQQHFKPVNFGGVSNNKALENYLKLKINDKIKTDYCNDRGIKLIRIPYWEFDDYRYIDRLNEILIDSKNKVV